MLQSTFVQHHNITIRGFVAIVEWTAVSRGQEWLGLRGRCVHHRYFSLTCLTFPKIKQKFHVAQNANTKRCLTSWQTGRPGTTVQTKSLLS
jgi:hypothetical protein